MKVIQLTQERQALVDDKAAKIEFGEYSVLNFPENGIRN